MGQNGTKWDKMGFWSFLEFVLVLFWCKTMDSESVQQEISQGESVTLEFKRCLPAEDKKYLKTLVAFANGSGGKLIFGVDDATKEIIGIPDDNCARLQDAITDMISDSCAPQLLPRFTWLSVNNKTLLVVEIFPSPHCPYYLKSEGKERGTYIRVGATSRRAEAGKIRELELLGAGRTYDEIVEHAVHPLSGAEIKNFCDKVKEYRHEDTKPVGVEQLLSWRLIVEAEGKYLPSNAFRILLGKSVHFSRIQCAVFSGLDKVHFLDRKEFEGPAYELLEQTQVFLLQHLNKSARIEGMLREDIFEIPVPVLRELVANAILHRNYLVHGFIQVSIFDDRVEILSPGGLYANLSREEMLAGNSRHRNPILADIFQRMGIVEKWGTGIRRVNELCLASGLERPDFEVSNDAVRVTIKRRRKTAQNTPAELSVRELAIYDYLRQHPGVTIRELAIIFNVSKSTMARLVKKVKSGN